MWVLETERLALRQFTFDDVDGMLEIFADPEAMRFYPAPFTRERTEGWIRWSLDSCANNGFGLWAVVRKEDGLLLGDCGPMLQPVEERTELEVGYHILRREWGRGYATEAARLPRLCLQHARLSARRLDRRPAEYGVAARRREGTYIHARVHLGEEWESDVPVLDRARSEYG
jgi:RimJ/RimL family protein N-acetyltransferase